MTAIALITAVALAAGNPAASADPKVADSKIADPKTVEAVKATCFDYIDGQLEGNPDRVARSLHPDLAKRAVIGDTPYERFGLRRMSKEELVDLTKQGVLKTPAGEWNRTCTVLDITGNAASVRLETPWFVDFFHMGNFGEKWLIVNALWYSKPKAK